MKRKNTPRTGIGLWIADEAATTSTAWPGTGGARGTACQPHTVKMSTRVHLHC